MRIYSLKNNLDKQRVPCTLDEYHPIYACVNFLVYAPILGSLNDWKIFTFGNLSTSEDVFDDIHKVILDGISSHTLSVVTHGYIGYNYNDDTKEYGDYIVTFNPNLYHPSGVFIIDGMIVAMDKKLANDYFRSNLIPW